MLRNIPSVNELLDSPPLRSLIDRANRTVVVTGVRRFLDNMRSEIRSAAAQIPIPNPSELAERIADWISREEHPTLRPVVNATGILLHTGLGRAPLAEPAVEAIVQIARGYASVEVDLDSGKRSQRVRAVEPLVVQATGADAACVVNNNAAATVLTLTALAAGREVIVSRGQLVEIGGSFRLPDVMECSGARLREVGTTNKTRIGDFRDAIGQDTAALMRVHTSNYAVVGFTEQPTLAELVDLGRKRMLPVIDDIGSGALHDFAEWGVEDEPRAEESLKAGADLVLFSGDKLLGGPQCGIIAGRADLVKRISKHPLMRAFRVDKITLAALEATLRLHRDPFVAQQTIPLLMLLSTPLENLRNRAERLAQQLAAAAAVESAAIIDDHTYLGGGSVPSQHIPTCCVQIQPAGLSVDGFAAALRSGSPAVMGRVQRDRFLLDLRSVFPSQDITLVERIHGLQDSGNSPTKG